MSSFFKKILKSQFLVLIISLCIFVSCSQVSPEINEVNYSVIFDYLDAESLPDARLSVFTQNESDVRRCERMIVESVETGYIWDFDDLIFSENDSLQWCGNTNLVAPDDKMIPDGKYKVTIIHADEKETGLIMTVNYDNNFYNLTSEQVENEMLKLNGIRRIIIYDKDNTVVYYGERNSDLTTKRDIWNMYREADSFNDIWYTPGQFLICIMPREKVIPEKEESLSEKMNTNLE